MCYKLLLKFWEGVVEKELYVLELLVEVEKKWCWVGSSPIFPGFLAPHGHNISHLYSMSLAHYFEVLLVITAYVEFIWNTLARFDNFYEIFWFMLNIEWIFPSSFECLSETHWWDFDLMKALILSYCDCMRMVLVEFEWIFPLSFECLSETHWWGFDLMKALILSYYDCMRMVLIDIEDCDPCCWEFLSLLYTCDLELLLEDKQV